MLPARLYARKESGGRVELLFVRPVADPKGGWIALARAPRGLGVGTRLTLADARTLSVAAILQDHRLIIVSEDGTPVEEVLNTAGMLALPHYIRREVGAADLDDYQTVYAHAPGAIAAPTAGLHFTERVFTDLATAGIRVARITLHIGPGTFAPVREAIGRGAFDGSRMVHDRRRRARGDRAYQAHGRPSYRGRHLERARARIMGDHRRAGRRHRASSSCRDFASNWWMR